MSIIAPIGRSSARSRCLFAGIYALLLCGALTMIYPFMLMVSGSMKSAVDIKHFEAIPGFLLDPLWLYRKHVEGLFNESLLDANMVYGAGANSFERLELPAPARAAALLSEWQDFLKVSALPDYAWQCGYQHTPYSRTLPAGLRLFKAGLRQRFGGDIDQVNQALGTDFLNWSSLSYVPMVCLLRRHQLPDTPLSAELNRHKASLPLAWRYYVSPEGAYKKLYLQAQCSGDLAKYNQTHASHYASWDDIHLTRSCGANLSPQARADWEQFVRHVLALQWLRVEPSATAAYHDYLLAKYARIDVLNRLYGTKHVGFEAIPLIGAPPPAGLAFSDWDGFISGWRDPRSGQIHQAPLESLRVHSVEFLFRDHLRSKYGSLAELNRQLGQNYPDFLAILPPQREWHWQWFQEHTRSLRWEFATRNYKAVVEYIILHGRGLLNTAIYCGLAVLMALLVNPLAAYALSRYRLPSTYKILLLLMATMAFPAMVTQIPSFLMLRQLNLLNTFAALILPGAANGFAIFLLKGFFDSLPRELYESAQLDGAGEWVMFWRLTMSLSKPILAVVALGAFTAAYANFMFAFVVCQNERMWTLMVWLYQLQQISGPGVMYASLIIAAAPTFLIFLFCQNIIMRGIVVPAEK